MPFDLQGHRGARGIRPENTLPSFEAALDYGVTSVETDIHLTADGVPVLCHDAVLGSTVSTTGTSSDKLICHRTLAELRSIRADRNPYPDRFPAQRAEVTRLAYRFAQDRGLEPYGIPTLAELFEFTAAYAGKLGQLAGKSLEQRERARRVRFELELKRVPFHPEAVGDGFDGQRPGRLEEQVIAAVRSAQLIGRTTVRSFDHRSVRCVKQLEPDLQAGVLIGDGAPDDPADLARRVGAECYFPAFEFVDADLVARAHAGGVRVVPWTVNRMADWERLTAMGVDGICTDHPDQLAEWLRQRGAEF